MRTRMLSRVVKLILLLLPIVIVWEVLPLFNPYRIVPETPAKAPRWVEDGRHYATCTDAMSGTTARDNPVAPSVQPAINAARAAAIGAGVIASQTNIHNICNVPVSFETQLVQKQFADGQTRLAWVYGEGCVTDKTFMSATTEFAYIDATTGEPLLLIKDMFAGDPSFTCPQISPLGSSYQMQSFAQSIQLFGIAVGITVAYLIALLIVALVRRRRRKALAALDQR